MIWQEDWKVTQLDKKQDAQDSEIASEFGSNKWNIDIERIVFFLRIMIPTISIGLLLIYVDNLLQAYISHQ